MDNLYGKIYIVSTPIGNLDDMTFRAINVLKNVDLIAAEDTRHTKELLNHFDIGTNLTSYHEHNKYDKAKIILDDIKKGKNVAVVTDAGTPIISDPGIELVKFAIEEGIEIIAIPGACALINALVVSGLNAENFVFVGFIPENKKKRNELFESLKNEIKTMIFYISPYDLKKDIEMLKDIFGDDRKVSLSREMTKKYEETIRCTLKELLDIYEDKDIKGEFVLVVDGKDKDELKNEKLEMWKKLSINEHFKFYLDKGFKENDAIKKVASDRELKKNEIYKMIKT